MPYYKIKKVQIISSLLITFAYIFHLEKLYSELELILKMISLYWLDIWYKGCLHLLQGCSVKPLSPACHVNDCQSEIRLPDPVNGSTYIVVDDHGWKNGFTFHFKTISFAKRLCRVIHQFLIVVSFSKFTLFDANCLKFVIARRWIRWKIK